MTRSDGTETLVISWDRDEETSARTAFSLKTEKPIRKSCPDGKTIGGEMWNGTDANRRVRPHVRVPGAGLDGVKPLAAGRIDQPMALMLASWVSAGSEALGVSL